MIGPLLGIVGFAVLFVVFGFAVRRERCAGNCGHCHGSCEWADRREETE